MFWFNRVMVITLAVISFIIPRCLIFVLIAVIAQLLPCTFKTTGISDAGVKPIISLLSASVIILCWVSCQFYLGFAWMNLYGGSPTLSVTVNIPHESASTLTQLIPSCRTGYNYKDGTSIHHSQSCMHKCTRTHTRTHTLLQKWTFTHIEEND